MRSFRIDVAGTAPDDCLLGQLGAGIEVDFEEIDRRVWTWRSRPLYVGLSVVVKKYTGVNAIEFEIDRVGPYVRPDIIGRDDEILR